MSVRLLLVDDHALMREGLRSILAREPDIQIVGEAENGREALELADKLVPDVVVMDIGMRDLNGVEATRQMVARQPGVRVLALSTYTDRRYVLAMLEAGASGYLAKAGVSEELLRAIRAAMRNQKYLSADVAGAVVDSYVAREFPKDAMRSVLAPREREVLQLLAEGKTSSQIAQVLGITASTVEVHRRNIMRKLDLHSVAELTKYAIREGLTSL